MLQIPELLSPAGDLERLYIIHTPTSLWKIIEYEHASTFF